MAVFDSTTLLYLLDPNAKPPTDAATGRPFRRAKERVDLLLETFKKRGRPSSSPRRSSAKCALVPVMPGHGT